MDFDFELKHENNNKAVLLFHGMTGSPFELKKFGQYLYNCGYDVYAPCLPGHGKDVVNLVSVQYTDWLEFAYKTFEELSNVYEDVFVSGLCLGAVLALSIAQKYDTVKGVISLSTTLFLDGWRMPWYNFLMPVGLSTIVRYYYTYPECEPYGIKNLKVRNVIKKLLSKNDVGLDNFPLTCIYELLRLSKSARKKLYMIKVPVLLIHSEEDDLTSKKSAELVYDKISSSDKELVILNDSYHMVLYDNEKEIVFEKCKEFLQQHSSLKESVLCLS